MSQKTKETLIMWIVGIVLTVGGSILAAYTTADRQIVRVGENVKTAKEDITQIKATVNKHGEAIGAQDIKQAVIETKLDTIIGNLKEVKDELKKKQN